MGISCSEGFPILHHKKKSVRGNKNKLGNKLLAVQLGRVGVDGETVHSAADSGRCMQITRTEVHIKHGSAAHSIFANGAFCVVVSPQRMSNGGAEG